MRLDIEVYEMDAVSFAKKVLGMILCRRVDDGSVIRQVITQTEAYYGECDTACHAYKGKTNRTKIMYERGGYAYIYLCYGVHNLLNIVTGKKDFPEAVLIRATCDYMGPGKLTKAMHIDRSLNGEDLVTSDTLWLETGEREYEYDEYPRVGIDYAEKADRDRLWRFVLKGEV